VSEELAEILGTGGGAALRVEGNGINVIGEGERKGSPRELFWPWFGANVSVLGLGYGAYVFSFGISFWQAIVVGLIIAGLQIIAMAQVYQCLMQIETNTRHASSAASLPPEVAHTTFTITGQPR